MNPVVKISSIESIDILVVVDTEYIKAKYPNPSTDKDNPTAIDHTRQYMFCSNPRGVIKNQGTGYLEFTAHIADIVRFRGTSISEDSDDAVIVYRIDKLSGTRVFNQFKANLVVRNEAAQPDPDSSSRDGLPALQVVQNFSNLSATVRCSGTENFWVCFALYTLKNGQSQELFGYYKWDPKIIVPA